MKNRTIAAAVAGLLGLSASLLVAAPKQRRELWETGQHLLPIHASDAKPGGELVLPAVGGLGTLRPIGAWTDDPLSEWMRDLYWPLVTSHPDDPTQIVPLLAEAWSLKEEGRVLIYRLRRHARWSDGRPITTRDVLHTLKMMGSAAVADPEGRGIVARIQGVRIVDNRTIVFRFLEPCPEGAAFASFPIFPAHIYSDLRPGFAQRYEATLAPTSGPYAPVSMERGVVAIFGKVEGWWGRDVEWAQGRFNPDRVSLVVVGSGEHLFHAFAKGGLDAMPFVEAGQWHAKGRDAFFQKGYGVRLAVFRDRPRDCVGMWLNSSNPLLADPQIREALIGAADMAAVAAKGENGARTLLKSCYDGYSGAEANLTLPESGPSSGSQAALDRAGFNLHDPFGVRQNQEGQRLSFPLVYLRSEDESVVKSLQDKATMVGIQLVLRPVSLDEWRSLYEQNAYGAFYGGFRVAGDGIPRFRRPWHSDATGLKVASVARIADPALDAMIESFEREAEPSTRMRHFRVIQSRIAAHKVFVPGLIQDASYGATKRWVRLPPRLGPRYFRSIMEPFDPRSGGLMWIDADAKTATLKGMAEGRTFEVQTIIDKPLTGSTTGT